MQTPKLIAKQKGATLIIFALILVLAATTYLVSQLDGTSIKIERDKKTSAALAEAKMALIGFAARSGTAVGTARPGDLPCPDTDNDGSTNVCLANAIGRLPWRTLGISDLRDGDGERLWYAVSVNFKSNPRIYPLSSDTEGTITLRDAAGNIINDGSLNNGLVAVVFSPGAAIRRQDAVNQVRDIANQNNAINYLDVALGEDNQSFMNGNADGFIKGPIKDANGGIIFNDQIISITHEEIFNGVEQRVISEVSNALLDYYCAPVAADYATKTCTGVAGNQFYPRPSLFSDASCLVTVDIIAPDCPSDVVVNRGRLPVTLATGAWNATSILRGTNALNNWFQRNGWREQIHYAVDAQCVDGTVNCGGGVGLTLTLNFAPNPVSRVIVIAAGRAQLGQSRLDPPALDKTIEINYLEDENALPLDDVYTRTVAPPPPVVPFNDHSVNIPQ